MVPEACNGCKLKEKSGKSRRLYFWDRLDWDVKLNSKDLEINSTTDIRYLDFTQVINATACITRPFVSTGWTKDGKKLNREMPDYWKEQPIGYHGADVTFMNNLFANQNISNLQWVALRGGEPCMMKSVKSYYNGLLTITKQKT